MIVTIQDKEYNDTKVYPDVIELITGLDTVVMINKKLETARISINENYIIKVEEDTL